MIDLKPRKEFSITLENGTVINGKFGTWALKRFCSKKNYTLSQMGAALTTNLTIDDMVDFILCAIEQSFRESKVKESFPYNDVDVSMWIDEMGGIFDQKVTQLFNHAGSKKKKNQEEAQT